MKYKTFLAQLIRTKILSSLCFYSKGEIGRLFGKISGAVFFSLGNPQLSKLMHYFFLITKNFF